MIIAAFDIGVKNFAFAVLDVRTKEWGDVLYIDVRDLREGNIYKNLIEYMKTYDHFWRKVDVILIEQQLNRMNIQATKLACHLYAYFLHQHPSRPIFEYPSTYKTKYTDFPLQSSTHKQRKEYAIQLVLDYYSENDPVVFQWISSFKKKDDISDCILMANTFIKSPLYRQFSASFVCINDKIDFDTRTPLKL
jgi:hypothetical protein